MSTSPRASFEGSDASYIEPENTGMFSLVMQKGIQGGYPAPEPRAIYFVTRATGSKIIMISVKKRTADEAFLKPVILRSLKIEDHRESVARLQQLMAEVPEQYSGVEDLYGRDTSIAYTTEYTRQADLHLSGPNAPKVPRPTEEQKVMFDEVIAIVEKWGS